MADGPLTIRPDGHGADVRTLFPDRSIGRARVLSGSLIHAIAALALLAALQLVPDRVSEAILPDRLPSDIVWLAQRGPGGGGGGGNRQPEPPQAAERKGADPVTVPAVQPPEPALQPVPELPVIEPPTVLPAELLAAGTTVDLGAIAPPAVSEGSRGGGTGNGAGPGRGDGLGPGADNGIGGGEFQPGNGVLYPVPIREVKPAYTAAALVARAQGTVGLTCVVQTDGSVRSCSVVQPLRGDFGLNDEAIKAAHQWEFRPGTRMGEPVPVRIRIELDFNLR